MKDIFGVYYICCYGEYYLNIVEEQLSVLKNSGLYDITKKIIIFVTLYKNGDNTNKTNKLNDIFKTFDLNNKFEIITSELNLFEKFAINNYKKYINSPDYYMYYFHTKGVTRNINVEGETIYHIIRKNLNFYTLTKYKINLELLEKYDVVGCSLSKYPKLHFSGNFWWTKSSHINNLPESINNNYLAPEMYICSYEKGKYISLSNTTNNNCLEETIVNNESVILKNITESIIDNSWVNSELYRSLC